MYDLIEKTHLQTLPCNVENINMLLKHKEKQYVVIFVSKKYIKFYNCTLKPSPLEYTLGITALKNLNEMARIAARNIYLSKIMSSIIPFHENSYEYIIISDNIMKYLGNNSCDVI